MKTRTGGQVGSSDGRAGFARAFTLVEVLISVVALALIAVGLATIFGAIGRTVAAGRSVSAFTSYAALIERQMRADFSRMSREFPLVIRNELAGDGPNVPLYPADVKPRPRRIDEIIFGVKDRFTSAREPLYPGYTARGDSASIYYGHGQRRVEDLSPDPNTNNYLFPKIDDSNADVKAGIGVSNNVNPNRYPADWTLLRHERVFTGPSTTQNPPPAPFDAYLDNELQVGLQPAASHPFRRLSLGLPDMPLLPPYDNLIRDPVRPQESSGIVDCVTSDFAEVRSIIETVDFTLPLLADVDLWNALQTGSFDIEPGIAYPNSVQSMHAWMDELFPAWSMAPAVKDRTRMRYEPAAPNYFAPLTKQPPYTDDIKSDWGRADQVMLSSSSFLPHCSEFIVEWSFGKLWAPLNPATGGWDAKRSGKVIWHGLTRPLADDPVKGLVKGELAHMYMDPSDPLEAAKDEFTIPYRRNDGTLGEYAMTHRRVHGMQNPVLPQFTAPLTSYFGYADPQFSPDRNNNNSLNDPEDAASSSIDWAWPRLIRVTISLADPNDPSVEQTFQFVFDAPGNHTR